MKKNGNQEQATKTQSNRNFSLLYPDIDCEEATILDEQTIKDLELDKLFEFITPLHIIRMFRFDAVRDVIVRPSNNDRTIEYRQDIFETLTSFPELLSAFEALLPIIDALNYFRSARYSSPNPLFKLASHIGELESYIGCLDTLKHAFDGIVEKEGRELRSAGLRWLYEHIRRTYEDNNFMHMKQHLPEIASKLREMRSVTIGINLSDSLNPIGATVISINSESFSDKSANLFNRLFAHTDDGYRGITPLRCLPIDQPGKKELFESTPKEQPFLRLLFKDISDMLNKLWIPLEIALSRYARVNTHLFTDLKTDFIFYIYCAKFLMTLRTNGMPITKPEIAPIAERIMQVEENYNVNLFIQMLRKVVEGGPQKHLVKNKVAFDDLGRIELITGPNQGGKTVYTQAIGLTQILFQSGMLVPGTKARISRVDGLFTHFQLEEHMANESGRFADEIKRLATIMGKVTSTSLLLMNESFASTSYVESLFIAKDVLRICRVAGLRVAFATHFHDLAMEVEEINNSIKGESKLISLVSVVGDNILQSNEVIRTFKIIPHVPIGKSYAGEIAFKYGINFEQLYDLLSKRGAI
jgi:DNA mismatch repair protein MutS